MKKAISVSAVIMFWVCVISYYVQHCSDTTIQLFGNLGYDFAIISLYAIALLTIYKTITLWTEK